MGDFEDLDYIERKASNHQKVFTTIKTTGKYRKAPSPLGEVIGTLESSTKIQLVDFKQGYWAIKHENQYGYISEMYVQMTEDSKNLLTQIKLNTQFTDSLDIKISKVDSEMSDLAKWYNDSLHKLEKKKGKISQANKERQFDGFEYLSAENQWELLIGLNRCLVGGQYCRKGTCGGDGCVMTKNKNWVYFLEQPRSLTVPFLIDKISDTTSTTIHTCPFSQAKSGELAIYNLQFIFEKNWYDLSSDYNLYAKREVKSASESLQNVLWEIIESPESLEKMQNLWRIEYEKKK
ncbi:MAG: SH3 domain-containing protein [Bacteroidia bacterium]